MIENIGNWQRTHYSNEISPDLDDKEVIVMGWVRELRDLGKIKFVKLADKEGFIQVIAKKDLPEDLVNKIESLGREDVIAVRGTVKKNKEAPNGVEIIPHEVRILNESDSPLPLELETKKTPALIDTRMDQRPLDIRIPENQAIFKIQAKLVEGMQKYLFDNGFVQVFTPCLMGTASESGSEVFSLPYFKTEAFLRQDPQLHRELTLIGGLDKIFDLGTSWRAESSHTIYHLCEHRGIAPEIAFIKDETDTMRLEEQLIIAGMKYVNDNCKDELTLLGKKIEVPKAPFPELRFPDVYKILNDLGHKIRVGDDLNREAETLLWKYVKEKYGSDFYFLNRFPSAIKPFYVMKVDNDPKWARSVDLIYKGLELSSGGQREHRYEELIKNAKERGLNLKNIRWFTDFFRYGAPPMGGFCIGIERFTMQLLELSNIKEATLFPRTPERILP